MLIMNLYSGLDIRVLCDKCKGFCAEFTILIANVLGLDTRFLFTFTQSVIIADSVNKQFCHL